MNPTPIIVGSKGFRRFSLPLYLSTLSNVARFTIESVRLEALVRESVRISSSFSVLFYIHELSTLSDTETVILKKYQIHEAIPNNIVYYIVIRVV